MASKTIQRSLAELKKRGYTAHVVERFNTFVKIRQDFGGFADILAYKAGEPGVLAVQACVGKGDVAKHVTKLKPLATVKEWLKSSNRFEIWSWAKRGERGKRKLWSLVVTPFQMGRTALDVTGAEAVASFEIDQPGIAPELNGADLGPAVHDEMPEALPF